MFSFGKSKRTVNMIIDDYIVRIVENNGKDLASIRLFAEKELPANIINSGRIVDELAFFEFMKTAVHEWGIKGRQVRFFVPQSLVILREIDLPEDVNRNSIKQYIHLEIGNTIHFPFKNPIFDIYSQTNESNKVTVLAAPEDELLKYTAILSDVSLKPAIAEIQPLGIYRYFLHKEKEIKVDDVFMMIEYNLSAANISIFYNHQVEFLRHQPLTLSKDDWEYNDEQGQFMFTGDETNYQGELDDQLNEIERLMNFYRFSIHHGEKEVNEIIVTGDSPHIEKIVTLIAHRYSIPVRALQVDEQVNDRPLTKAYIPALGLALRGGK